MTRQENEATVRLPVGTGPGRLPMEEMEISWNFNRRNATWPSTQLYIAGCRATG
ncbi:hypothetical protein [Roseiconus nitratireducens]|uniref:hypothetical protein n=1 Tax=Roseiconus nitratireducens TaxID=2605748 RepID=UPI001F463AC7|nr:hypothetical protein [Roseiconus nitratireducens]